MSDERILELIEKQDKYYVLGFIKGIKANRDTLLQENKELKSQLDEANKKLYLCTPEIPQNVHGEYVSYVDLVNEIYELKKQLEELTNENNILDTKINKYIEQKDEWIELISEFKSQQQEFLKYLEDEIIQHTPKARWKHYNEDGFNDYDVENGGYIENQPVNVTLEKALSKYKSVIGDDINVGSKGGNKDDK